MTNSPNWYEKHLLPYLGWRGQALPFARPRQNASPIRRQAQPIRRHLRGNNSGQTTDALTDASWRIGERSGPSEVRAVLGFDGAHRAASFVGAHVDLGGRHCCRVPAHVAKAADALPHLGGRRGEPSLSRNGVILLDAPGIANQQCQCDRLAVA